MPSYWCFNVVPLGEAVGRRGVDTNDGLREAGEGSSGGFETTQASYRAAIANTFTLQEQTLEFARNLIEAPAEDLRVQAENNRAALEALVEQSRRQREAMENLVKESAKVYENLLQSPFSHHQNHPGFEEATGASEVNR